MDKKDRISDLQEPLLHLILSSLNIKEVVQTSLLSRKWRSVWFTLPYLNIKEQFWKFDGKVCEEKFEFFVDRILCRDDFNIHKFYLSCKTYSAVGKYGQLLDRNQERRGQRYQIDKWVRYVLGRNVQELQLKHIDIPNSTLASAASQVKVLRLKHVLFQQGELLLSCPYMETLIIEGCSHGHLTSLTIDAPQLKYLTIENWGTSNDNDECDIKICAPNLISIILEGCLYNDYCLDKFPVLDDAYIVCNGDEPEGALRFNQFLIAVASAKSLTITVDGFQCPEESGTLEWIPVSFPNLKYLKLIGWQREASLGPISTLLESFPHLEFLVLEVGESRDIPDIESGELGTGMSLRCKFLNLKCIEIHDLEGCQNELKLLEFLVRNASVSETIRIIATITSENQEMKLIKFSKKLQLLTKASSVKIFLLFSDKDVMVMGL